MHSSTRSLAFFSVTLLGLVALTSIARADAGQVRLTNGGRIHGDIVVYVPGVRVSIRGDDGELYTFPADEIASVDFDAEDGGSQPAPAPTADQSPDPSTPQTTGPVPYVERGNGGPEPSTTSAADTTTATDTTAGPPASGAEREELLAEREKRVQESKGWVLNVAMMGLGAAAFFVGAGFLAASTPDRDDTTASPFFGEGCGEVFDSDDCSISTGTLVGAVMLGAGGLILISQGILLAISLGKRKRALQRIEEIDGRLGESTALRWDLDVSPRGARLMLQGTF